MIQAGIFVEALGMSQQSYTMIKELNTMHRLDVNIDVIAFYNTYDKSIIPNRFCMLQEREMWGYNQPVIATNLATATKLIKCPAPTKKYLYMWDLEWIYNFRYEYSFLRGVYQHDELQLIARSQFHSDIITNCWKEPVAIIEDFNHAEIIKLIN